MRHLSIALASGLLLAGCSSPKAESKRPETAPVAKAVSTAVGNHPLAKFLELAGFRLSEESSSKLRVQFVAINHSEADLGDIGVKVRLYTTAAKPGDPPLSEFETMIPAVGPNEIKDVAVAVPSKLRVYELPDWQFIRAEFEITSPAP